MILMIKYLNNKILVQEFTSVLKDEINHENSNQKRFVEHNTELLEN